MSEAMPYQIEGAQKAASRRRFGIFDEPGAGKTLTLIIAADLLRAVRIVVICPAVVREHWRNEFLTWQRMPRRVCKGVSIHDFSAWRYGKFDVLITSFELAAKWSQYIIEDGEILHLVIIDEAHGLKDAGTARTRAIMGQEITGHSGLLAWAVNALWATGSPSPNDPADIYTFLCFAECMPLGREAFIKRYFNSRPRAYGNSSQDPKLDMLPELQQLIANNSIRRRLEDVGVQLPQLWITNMLIDGDDRAVRDLLRQFPGLDRKIMQALEEGQSLARLDEDHIATLRRLIGEAKAIPYAQLLLNDLESGLKKAVFFGVHRTALELATQYLAKQGVRVGLVYGATSEADRVRLVRTFQTEESMQVIALNIKTGGTGLTLTAAANLDMMESDWSPYNNVQAFKRIHRIGQASACRARFITLANSFDCQVNQIVAAKSAAIAELEGAPVVGGAAPEPVN